VAIVIPVQRKKEGLKEKKDLLRGPGAIQSWHITSKDKMENHEKNTGLRGIRKKK